MTKGLLTLMDPPEKFAFFNRTYELMRVWRGGWFVVIHVFVLVGARAFWNGMEWIEEGKKKPWEIVRSPANSSHFLQSCDQDTNLLHSKGQDEFRDAIKDEFVLHTRTIYFKFHDDCCWLHEGNFSGNQKHLGEDKNVAYGLSLRGALQREIWRETL